jgi:hypothetical protein
MSEKKKVPAFLEVARRFYGSAFGSGKRQEIAASMAEWNEMSPAEQRFAIAHLAYLNLEAQAAVLRALGRLEVAVEDVAFDLDEPNQGTLPPEDHSGEPEESEVPGAAPLTHPVDA